ncbi:histidine kinase [Streptomyces sp. NPDC026672]|uniref:sensor histidine kinase n=1 Tax=unclassified Streptomyces TaxID=2593676 RepID=UPI0033DB8771
MSGPGGWWHRKSTPAKVETYTRWSFHSFAVMEAAVLAVPTFGQPDLALAAWATLALVTHAALCAVTAARALDWTRGRRERPLRLLWTLGAVTFAVALAALLMHRYGPSDVDARGAALSVFIGVMVFGGGVVTLGVRGRRQALAVVTGCALGAGALSFLLGIPGPAALVSALVVLLGAGFLAFTCVFSIWLLDAVYELDEARETRARLAVAEERLRFGRDLHDVLGRNLAVIALKSELAVQLARRGRPEAVAQMVEAQRIAQESQREVREVVRGYREADLGVELAGAQGVLGAAGIRCEVTGEAAGLPAEVQSALAWVVREATTNVLRHGNAAQCRVGLRVREGRVVLTVENDGVTGVDDTGPDGTGTGGTGTGGTGTGGTGTGGTGTGGTGTGGTAGSGLAGLRERLAAVAGTLEAGPVGEDGFRLTARVPLAPAGESTGTRVSEVTS